jgi:hypothetical protein
MMKSKLWTIAGALVVIVVLGKFYGEPVVAQVRAALVKNVDEPGRIPFDMSAHFFGSGGGCFGTSDCFNYSGGSNFAIFDMRPIPAGKRWVVQSATGGFTSAVGQVITVQLANSRGGLIYDTDKWIYSGPFFASQPFDAATFAANLAATFEPGETPTVRVNFGATNVAGYSTLMLHGYLIDATN